MRCIISGNCFAICAFERPSSKHSGYASRTLLQCTEESRRRLCIHVCSIACLLPAAAGPFPQGDWRLPACSCASCPVIMMMVPRPKRDCFLLEPRHNLCCFPTSAPGFGGHSDICARILLIAWCPRRGKSTPQLKSKRHNSLSGPSSRFGP
jgi:hypothetical protein